LPLFVLPAYVRLVTLKDLTELQKLLESVETRFVEMRDKTDDAKEIGAALDVVLSTVTVHRIRAEVRNSEFPFEVKPPEARLSA
jgi:hypothetical protein